MNAKDIIGWALMAIGGAVFLTTFMWRLASVIGWKRALSEVSVTMIIVVTWVVGAIILITN